MCCREELRGVKRGPNAKDIDWSKVANALPLEEATKPEPIKIPVSELIGKVKSSKPVVNSLQAVSNKNGKSIKYGRVEERTLESSPTSEYRNISSTYIKLVRVTD